MAAPRRSEAERREDLKVCHELLAKGSKSFAAASRMFPRRIHDHTAELYGFCRTSDDAVDLSEDPGAALARMYERLDRIYAGQPEDDPVDRCFCDLVHEVAIPKTIPAALLDGFAWDAEQRRYETAAELEAYCVRVASTVGMMMILIFGERSPVLAARGCDLGLAMQLTNICRDVGEDARAGRIYLPLSWLVEAGIDPDRLLARPEPSPALASVVRRTLDLAEHYYRRADGGMRLYPRDCRLAVKGARLIYAEIGRMVERNRYDSVTRRAYTSKARKLLLLARAMPTVLWPGKINDEPPAPAAQFLVDALARASKKHEA